MSRTFNMVGGGGGKAVLAVTVTNGTATSVTATKSGVSVSLTYDSSIGVWTAELPSFGTWTVTITDGTHSNTASVSATQAGLYTVTIYMPDVPIGYTQLEWVEGVSGVGSEIDTGIYPVSNNRFAGEFQTPYFDGSGSNGTDVVFAYKSQTIYIGINARNGSAYYRYFSSRFADAVDIINVNTSKHSYNARAATITFDGVRYTISIGTRVTSNSDTKWLIGFGDHVHSPLVRQFRFKAYNTGDTALIADMIPAIRNSDSVVGMYDVVRNAFYAPTNTIVAGPAV